MCKCEFCHTSFCPRPQVKRPRACKDCQGLRQQANELDWRERNPNIFDEKYHAIKKKEREATLAEFSKLAVKYLSTGALLVGVSINIEKVGPKILELFLSIGIREINKLWPANSDMNSCTC